ncbi:hypothetical protein LOK49_LG05G03274 [Camellia lanceoleosa]|uniref:Uncharacterized protein n=1 Tax=Camellia lanceoleosa TaxID=1840588 RepID=A0ACC0HSQ2_9ERIC|nr:hypothetical protein LOK49_LG05G03274 [Camellia lanceoleosa]
MGDRDEHCFEGGGTDVAEEDTTAIWVRFPNLQIEYYSDKVLFHIAKVLGKPLKVDINTAMATRGKYMRVCVEMDLRKPLLSYFAIGKYNYVIEYEHLHTFCFSCGKIGHRKDSCSNRLQMVPEKTTQIAVEGEKEASHLVTVEWWIEEVKVKIKAWWQFEASQSQHLVIASSKLSMEDNHNRVREMLGTPE